MGKPLELDAPRPGQRRCCRVPYVALAVVALAGWHLLRPTARDALQVRVAADTTFDWSTLPPSATLEWVACYKEPFQCARLEVPLDYAKPHGQKAAIAMIKYPSKYPVGDANWRGPILYNPGGPGGSGVDTVLSEGANFSAIIGDDFDHIGFDPRGIGKTTPQLSALPSAAERFGWQLAQPGPINSTEDALARLHGFSKIIGELVEERQARVAAHMSTAIVARDMLHITKAHGRDKLQYWGFSYGTVLGVTFSSMFPDNVGRVLVDGVVDTENYYSTAWDSNLVDADKNFATVLQSCAGSSACPLHEATAELVRARVDRIVDSLKVAPVPVHNGSSYGLVDFGLVRSLMFQSLYGPYKAFPRLFDALATLEKSGDGAPLFKLSAQRNSLWRCNCGAPPEELNWIDETTMAVACGDGEVVSRSLQELRQFYNDMAGISSFADMWPFHAYCTGWKIRPVERYTGPFTGNTSHPLLFIGNTADPVTPLSAANKMSKRFSGAVVLTQNSPGHCSTAAPSLCTAQYIRAYFRNGTLPAPGTVCEVEDEIFPQDAPRTGAAVRVLSTEDARLLRAAQDLSASINIPLFGQPGRR